MTNMSLKDIKLSNLIVESIIDHNQNVQTVTFTPTTFTTNRKTPKSTIDICRKGSIVKERCRQLTSVINDMFPSQVISDRDLADLIEEYIGADKETLRSYKGYGGSVRLGRAGDNKIVGVSRKGYLERFGFLTHIRGRNWVVSQALLPSKGIGKAVSGDVSNHNLSISASGMGSELLRTEKVSNNELEEEDTERDRNLYPKICPKIAELSPLELAILTAKPSTNTDRTKISRGES
jgi:hypothetical protein